MSALLGALYQEPFAISFELFAVNIYKVSVRRAPVSKTAPFTASKTGLKARTIALSTGNSSLGRQTGLTC